MPATRLRQRDAGPPRRSGKAAGPRVRALVASPRGVLLQQIDELAHVVHLREIFRHRGARGRTTWRKDRGISSEKKQGRIPMPPRCQFGWLRGRDLNQRRRNSETRLLTRRARSSKCVKWVFGPNGSRIKVKTSQEIAVNTSLGGDCT